MQRMTPVSDFVKSALSQGRLASDAGVAAATSMVQLCVNELDGSVLDREVAREYAKRILRSYFDQVERIARRDDER